MRTLHLFAGAGGGILADILLGHRPICAVECDDYAQRVLQARIADGCLPWFPIYPDVCTFDGGPWRGLVDCVSGGFPCQDISAAGRGAGITGERSGLWKEFARIIREVGPRYVFVENSPMLTSRGLGTVLGDLAEMGYDARWGVLGASNVGARHQRERVWIVGSDHREKRVSWKQQETLPRFASFPWGEDVRRVEDIVSRPDLFGPVLRRKPNEVADYVDRISAIGNGQVPAVAALAWETLK